MNFEYLGNNPGDNIFLGSLIYSNSSEERERKLACSNLGSIYEKGIGTEKNPEKAVQHFQIAADLNLSRACFQLCYEEGKDTKQNLVKAFEYYQKAADLGYTKAYSKLAFYYLYGKGTPKNIDNAAYYYKMII